MSCAICGAEMLALFSTGFLQIQSDGKSCAFSKSTVAGDGTFHKIYQLFHNRQGQTGISYTIEQADLAIRQKAFVYSQPDTPNLRSAFYCIGKRIHQGLHLAVIVNKVVTADKFHKGKKFPAAISMVSKRIQQKTIRKEYGLHRNYHSITKENFSTGT